MKTDPLKIYESRKRKLEEALSLIKTGDHIFVGSACGEPQYLVRGLVEKASHLSDNEILHLYTLGVAPYAESKYSDRFRLNTFFVGATTREAVADGRADYTPVFLSELPKMISKG
ncbi:MAG: hypothetical protein QXR15_03770, partial [Candidatus Hadarchaeales archaeon]